MLETSRSFPKPEKQKIILIVHQFKEPSRSFPKPEKKPAGNLQKVTGGVGMVKRAGPFHLLGHSPMRSAGSLTQRAANSIFLEKQHPFPIPPPPVRAIILFCFDNMFSLMWANCSAEPKFSNYATHKQTSAKFILLAGATIRVAQGPATPIVPTEVLFLNIVQTQLLIYTRIRSPL